MGSASTQSKRRLDLARQFATLACLAFLVIGAEAPQPSLPKADWSQVPPEVRRWLHLTVADLPAYPESSAWLMNVHRWPPARVFKGKTYRLEFGGFKYDVFTHKKSLAEIPAGWNYHTRYVATDESAAKSGPGLSPHWFGPSYWWRTDSTLSERGYTTDDWHRVWAYSKRGNVHLYQFKERDSIRSGWVHGDEWFDAEGKLIACRMGGKEYWLGSLTHWRDLYRRLQEYGKQAGYW